MKIREITPDNISDELIEAFIRLFSYSIHDIKTYQELTKTEKSCISEELFNQIAVPD